MLSSKKFITDGISKRFMSDFIIESEQHARVYIYQYEPTCTTLCDTIGTSGYYIRKLDAPQAADLVGADRYDIVDNSVSFYDAYVPAPGLVLYVEVASQIGEFSELLTTPAVERAIAAAEAAEVSEANALSSENAASASETASALSATNALASETAAALSEAAAALSETNASASEVASALSESNASTSEANALASANAAALSETNAGASETAAALSETNASASETAAALSETNAAASESSAAAIASALENNMIVEDSVATAAQTVVTTTAPYSVGNNSMQIYINGISQHSDAYTETNANTITFLAPLDEGDKIKVYILSYIQLDLTSVQWDAVLNKPTAITDTTAPFTIALDTKLDGIEAGATADHFDSINSHIIPALDNTYDLGKYLTNSWNALHVDNIYLNNNINALNLGQNIGSATVRFGNMYSENLHANTSIQPITNNTSSVGTATKSFLDGYITNIHLDTTNFNTNLSALDDTVQKAFETIDDLVLGGGNISGTMDGDVIPDLDNTHDLGSATKRVATGYFTNVVLWGNISTTGVSSIGTTSDYFSSLYMKNGNFLNYVSPTTTNTASLGSSLKIWGDAYIRNLNLSGATEEGEVSFTTNIDCSLSNVFTQTVTGSFTQTFSNLPASGTAFTIAVKLINGGVGTITWATSIKWVGGTAPTLSASGTDMIIMFTDDGGVTWNANANIGYA